MFNDKTTLKDLSIFSSDQDGSIFALLDFTITLQGKEVLKRHIISPPGDYGQVRQIQQAVKFWTTHLHLWPAVISNGTLVMLEKFFEAADHAVTPPSPVNMLFGTFLQKLLNKNEYSFTQFSLSHLSDFLKGCRQLTEVLNAHPPARLEQELQEMNKNLEHELASEIISIDKNTPYRELAKLSYRARREMKHKVFNLMRSYAMLDSWQAMAKATGEHKWVFPELLPSEALCFEAENLRHPLLKKPVPYNVNFGDKTNFMLLTGANMSGKTTFMRALGVTALLAHMGMGVPAERCRISFMEGVISNMQVEDNLLLGESYFFAEVQRMKLTARKLQQPGTYLVLMDELFKGTNVHDAYECTRAVIEGLLNKPRHIMILSTHLHEVAAHFAGRQDMIFNYFVTDMTENGAYHFTYELKKGISDDSIGYRILMNEGVIDLLKNG